MKSELLKELNREQTQAVTHKKGPLMIIAGAGTGKTSVITKRIAWLIEQQLAKPEEILALTFTDKAATEMEERVDRLLPLGYVDLSISTFHSFCEKIVREYGIEIGLPSEFTLLTEVDALLLMRRNFDQFNLDYYRPRGNPTKFLQPLLKHFSRLKDETITPAAYIEHAEKLKIALASKDPSASEEQEEERLEVERITELANAYKTYQNILLQHSAFDFGDLILYALELLKQRANIRGVFHKRFRYVLVDEFQDTNSAQYELVKLLLNKEQNITVVGDDDQSIYKFRGASLSNILSFRTDFPKAKKIVLQKNYRSTKAVLDYAYALIQKNNPHRLEAQEQLNKELLAQTEEAGVVEYHHCETGEDEVEAVIQKIITLRNQGVGWGEMAILVRGNNSAEPFAEAFDLLQVPYRFLALSGLYTKPIILDVLAYLRVIHEPQDSPSMYRTLTHARLGIQPSDAIELTYLAKRKGKTLFEAMKMCGSVQEISTEGQTRIRDLIAFLSRLNALAKQKTTTELFHVVLQESGLLGDIRLQNEREQQEQFQLLQQFFVRLKKFEQSNDQKDIRSFLEEFKHEREAGESGSVAADEISDHDSIQIMTIHASKGLEFPHVFVVNLVEQRFPSQSRKDPIDIPPELVLEKIDHTERNLHIEEERRLFYVAITRAKKGLYLYAADHYNGGRKRKPSRFLQELAIERNQSTAKHILFGEKTPIETKPTSNTAFHELPKSLSFTQVDQFLACPLKYKFSQVLKIPVFGRHSLSFGQTMHTTLQKFMELLQKQQLKPQSSLFEETNGINLPPKSELINLYKESWRDEWYPNDALRNEYKQNGLSILQEFYRDLQQHIPTIAFLEKGFTLKVGDITVKGRIDRIDQLPNGEIEIIDYKTGTPKQKIDAQAKRQLILYQLAVEQCFNPPLKVGKLSYYYLENNTKVSFEAKPKEKEKLEQELKEVGSAIQTTNFEATPGQVCVYCDYKDICEFSAL